MQITAVSTLALFAAVAIADNSGNSTESLSQLISELPPCALPCFEQAAKDAGCSTTDFNCYCNEHSSEFTSSITPCIQNDSDCSIQDLLNVGTTADNFCKEVRNNPSSTELAAATSVATSVLAAATNDDQTGRGARAAEYGMGLAGAAAIAAFAM